MTGRWDLIMELRDGAILWTARAARWPAWTPWGMLARFNAWSYAGNYARHRAGYYVPADR